MLNDRWKIEFRSLPQVQIRYGYFGFFLVAMPALGISACTLCNFITIPRLIEALSGEYRGMVFLISSVGLVNLGLLLILGFFASKGRAYCQFMCPIGAADGLVNRLGAKFNFTHRIRVEKERCTGCNICARNCMCGAIKMVDKIATIDQLSCMSCHECVDVCDWNALEWTTVPDSSAPKRIKKGVEIHPQPDWQVVNIVPNKVDAQTATFKPHSMARMVNAFILLSVLSVIIVGSFVL
jgi:polyferredoxin